MDARTTLLLKTRIRKTVHDGEWWFAGMDAVAVLTRSSKPRAYLKDMRKRDARLAKALKRPRLIPPPLALMMPTSSGDQKLLSWNTEGIVRLIQSIPSPKTAAFKRKLARAGMSVCRRT